MVIDVCRIEKYSSTILNTFEIKYSNAYYEYIIFLFM